jgi:type II secretory pathway pseudopilin PulG
MPYCSGCGKQLAAETTQCPACGKLVPGTAQPKTSKAVWVVVGAGCLVVGLAFAGIFAALLIPNFLDSLEKAKTKRTMADLRNVGTALEAYRVDHDGAVPAVDSMDDLAAELEAAYIDTVPRLDGWKNPILYTCWGLDSDRGCDSYVLASAGRDGAFEHDDLGAYDAATFDPADYDHDLVYGDGLFLRHPEYLRDPEPVSPP